MATISFQNRVLPAVVVIFFGGGGAKRTVTLMGNIGRGEDPEGRLSRTVVQWEFGLRVLQCT